MTAATPDEAKQISQGLLELTGEAIMSGDFSRFEPHFNLPHEVSTFEKTVTIKTIDDLREVFEGIQNHVRTSRTERLIRECVEACFIDDNIIEAMHETRTFRGGTMVLEPSLTLATLKKIDNTWKVAKSDYAIKDSSIMNRALTMGSKPIRGATPPKKQTVTTP